MVVMDVGVVCGHPLPAVGRPLVFPLPLPAT